MIMTTQMVLDKTVINRLGYGTTSIAHLEENVASARLATQLTSEEIDTLTGLVSEHDAHLAIPAQITSDTLSSVKRD